MTHHTWSFKCLKNGLIFYDLYSAANYLDNLKNYGLNIGLTSGGYDPIHAGHISCIQDSVDLCDALVVVVNGDEFIRRKKKEKEPFQPGLLRAEIVSSIRGVHTTILFDATEPSDLTVCEALRVLRPNKFFKGGDRNDISKLPEASTCKEFRIEIVTGMGDTKKWSSSDFLKKWDERKNNNQTNLFNKTK